MYLIINILMYFYLELFASTPTDFVGRGRERGGGSICEYFVGSLEYACMRLMSVLL